MEEAALIAELPRRRGARVIGVATTLFLMERELEQRATSMLSEMRKQCDAVIVMNDENLMQLMPQLSRAQASRTADQLLASVIKRIIEATPIPHLASLGFDDIKAIVRQGGITTVVGGERSGARKVEEGTRNALRAPLVDLNYAGARGALIDVAGDSQVTIEEANRPHLHGKLKVTLVMTVNSVDMRGGLNTIAPQLFNLEPHAEPEKPLGIRLNLYQMENS
jgi:cell division protein FtsZ